MPKLETVSQKYLKSSIFLMLKTENQLIIFILSVVLFFSIQMSFIFKVNNFKYIMTKCIQIIFPI